MNRRRFIGAMGTGALALLAGCLGGTGGSPSEDGGDGGDGGDTGQNGTASSATPTPTPIPDGDVDVPAGPETEPTHPDNLDRETVSTFATAYEYGIVYNSLWEGEDSTVSVSCDVHDATETAVGWKVVVSCRGYAEIGGGPKENGTGTTTPLHADYFREYYTYLVDEDSVVRRESTAAEKPR